MWNNKQQFALGSCGFSIPQKIAPRTDSLARRDRPQPGQRDSAHGSALLGECGISIELSPRTLLLRKLMAMGPS